MGIIDCMHYNCHRELSVQSAANLPTLLRAPTGMSALDTQWQKLGVLVEYSSGALFRKLKPVRVKPTASASIIRCSDQSLA